MTQINNHYPLNDAAFDVVSMLHHKSQALLAYEHYLADVQHDTALRQALVEIRHDEQRHIQILKSHLARIVNEPSFALSKYAEASNLTKFT